MDFGAMGGAGDAGFDFCLGTQKYLL